MRARGSPETLPYPLVWGLCGLINRCFCLSLILEVSVLLGTEDAPMRLAKREIRQKEITLKLLGTSIK